MAWMAKSKLLHGRMALLYSYSTTKYAIEAAAMIIYKWSGVAEEGSKTEVIIYPPIYVPTI
jgi:hypothetical protein